MADAIDAVGEGGTVNFSSTDEVTEPLTVTKSVNIAANGATFNSPITVSGGNVSISGANIVASGSSSSDKTPAISVIGSGDFSLTGNNIAGSSRNAVLIKTSGKVDVSSNTFNAGEANVYNAIEFGINSDPDVTDVTIENNTFTGTLGNNAISMYNFADGAQVNIKNNTFSDIAVNNNPVRLSNNKNVTATFNIENNAYNFVTEEPQDYTGFMLLQDYSTGDAKQDFSKFNIHFVNLKRGDKKLMEKGTGIDRVYYVYDDQDGILEDGVNDPVVTFA